MALTVLTEDEVSVAGEVVDGRALIDAGDLSAALGWELKPEGLCQADVCVPVSNPDAIRSGDQLDVAAVATALGRPSMVDQSLGAIVVGSPKAARQNKLGAEAPPFELPDLAGQMHTLEAFRGRKKLLFAFASW